MHLRGRNRTEEKLALEVFRSASGIDSRAEARGRNLISWKRMEVIMRLQKKNLLPGLFCFVTLTKYETPACRIAAWKVYLLKL